MGYLHSPILINAQPDFDLEYDEWEYLTDEYWDGDNNEATKKSSSGETDPRSQEKMQNGAEQAPNRRANDKRRKLDEKRDDVKRRPLVIWRSKSMDNGRCLPMLKHGDGQEIVVLKNWRELLNQSPAATTPRRSSSIELEPADSNSHIGTSNSLLSEKSVSSQCKRRCGEDNDYNAVGVTTGHESGCDDHVEVARNTKRIKT